MKFSTLWAAIALAAATGVSAMGASNDVVSTIAKRLNWPVNKSSIRQMKLDGLENCEIYDAYDERVLDGASVGVARLKDGSLILGSEANALSNVFAKCISPATPAGTLATLLTSFSRYAGLRVLHDNSLGVARALLKQAGQDFVAPEIVAGQGGRVVRFFALSTDGSVLYRVEGHIGSQVTVNVERL
jgi:hypothetical protein